MHNSNIFNIKRFWELFYKITLFIKNVCINQVGTNIETISPLWKWNGKFFFWKVGKQCPLLVMGDIQLTIFQLGTSHTHTTQHPQKPSQLELLLSIPQTFAINPCVAILWGLIYKTLLLLLHLFIYFRSKVSVWNQ